MSRSLNGLRVALTGGARGIGLATATELTRLGAKVTIGDLDLDVAQAAAGAKGLEGATQLDVTDRSSYAKFLATAGAAGPVDVLINNAGIMPIGGFLEQSPETYRRVFDINVMGCLHGMHLALPGMVERGTGHIVNVASTAGRSPVPGGLAYCGSKAAVRHLTETARVEFGQAGIDFTCVFPHFTNTELIAGTKGMKLLPTVEPADVARAIARAIAKRKKDVTVPKVVGPMLSTQPAMGRRLRDGLSRKLGAYDTFLDIDTTERARYDDRVRNS
jgi:NAD(P)-dependent dehydrogenase (short-subunit alcohol dehydrogenase family)